MQRAIAHAHRVRIVEHGLPADEVDLVLRNVLAHDLAERADHLLLAVHEVVNGEVGLDRVVDAVQAALPEPREVQRRLA